MFEAKGTRSIKARDKCVCWHVPYVWMCLFIVDFSKRCPVFKEITAFVRGLPDMEHAKEDIYFCYKRHSQNGLLFQQQIKK